MDIFSKKATEFVNKAKKATNLKKKLYNNGSPATFCREFFYVQLIPQDEAFMKNCFEV